MRSDAERRTAAPGESPTVQESSREPPVVTLAQSCQGLLAPHGFWLERYGSSLGLNWVRFRRVLRDSAMGVCTQVFLVAHDRESQQFLADDYLVQDRLLLDEADRHAAWSYADVDELPAVMQAVCRTLQEWATLPPRIPGS